MKGGILNLRRIHIKNVDDGITNLDNEDGKAIVWAFADHFGEISTDNDKESVDNIGIYDLEYMSDDNSTWICIITPNITKELLIWAFMGKSAIMRW